jgi:TonB family protein
MNNSQRGNTLVPFMVVVGMIIVLAALLYRYHRDLQRYLKGPRALPHTREMRSHALPRLMPVTKSLPTFTILGALQGRPIIRKVMPDYPTWAEEKGVSTQVQLAFRVNNEGNVASNIWITRTGQPDFDEAAVRALRQWKFVPVDRPVVPTDKPDVLTETERGEPGVINFNFVLAPAAIRT